MSLALPWEVIERVIEHCTDSVVTLYSFTLTCRNLNPRSTIVLCCHVSFKSRQQIFSFCDVLDAKPHLKHAVRAITVSPKEFSPHPLLRLLDNLTEMEFAPPALTSNFELHTWYNPQDSVLHPSALTYCRVFADRTSNLILRDMTFSCLSTFCGFLLSFPKIKSLSCLNLRIKNARQDWEPATRLISRRRISLETLAVPVRDNAEYWGLIKPLEEATKHTVKRLALYFDYDIRNFSSIYILGLLPSSDWVQLTSLVLRFPIGVIQQIPQTLDHLGHPEKLEKVTLQVNVLTIGSIVAFLRSQMSLTQPSKLETALLQFPKPRIDFSLSSPLIGRSPQFWRHRFEDYFPVLRTRDAVTLQAQYTTGRVGHDSRITTSIAISSDSRWAATGSEDDTIIIWDLHSGTISQEWLVHTPLAAKSPDDGSSTGGSDSHPRHLNTLLFSPDNRYLASTGSVLGVTLWDLHRNAFNVASLGVEHGIARHCAWSSDGAFIVAAFSDSNRLVCAWEASTLQQLGAYHIGRHSVLLAFSPDGRWLLQVTRESPRIGNIWNVISGELHRELRAPEPTGGIVVGVFDPSSTWVAVAYAGEDDSGSSIRIWDVETGQCSRTLATGLGTHLAIQYQRAQYSSDGQLLLSMFYSPSGSRTFLWDTSNGNLLSSLVETPDFGNSSYSCFSPCSRYVASISAEGSVILWWISHWSCFARISESENQVRHIAITPDGRLLCCGREDGTMFFRQLRDFVPTDGV